MPKFSIGWMGCFVLLAMFVICGFQAQARAESSWSEGFEIYPNGGLIFTPWAGVGAYADGTYVVPKNGIMAAHLGDSTGGYMNLTSHRLSRAITAKYAGTTVSFWASYIMNDNSDVFVFEYSNDGGYTWVQSLLPTTSTSIVTWTQFGPYTLPVGTNFIRFRFDTDSSGNMVNPAVGGVWIDEVKFTNPGYPIYVLSDYGDPIPANGYTMVPETQNSITCSVTSPFNDPIYAGNRYLCTGWTGDGVVFPAAGTASSVNVVVNSDGAYITWNWKTQYAVQTVSQSSIGAPDTEQWYWYDIGAQANITGIKYIESTQPGYGWRCSGFVGSGSAPASGTFAAGGTVDLTFSITQYSIITWLWVDQYKVFVQNPGNQGNPIPAFGDNWFDTNIIITATIDSIVAEGETIRHLLLGYEVYYGSAVLPSLQGTTRVIDNIILAGPARIVWLWRTDNLLDIRNPQFIGTISPDVATYWIAAGTTQNLTAKTPASDGVNNWLPIAYIRNSVITYLTDFDNPIVTITMSEPVIFTWVWELQTLPFRVISQFGLPNPAVGSHPYSFDATVTASINSPYMPPGNPGVMNICTGYTATGSILPAVSSQLSVTFKLRHQNTTITWNWYTQYKLVVLSEIPDVIASPEVKSAGFWYIEGSAVNASVESQIPGYRCSGYLVTEGESQAVGSTPYVSLNISGPTTITWRWTEDSMLTKLPEWKNPLQISNIDSSLGVYVSMRRNPVTGRPSAAYYKIDGSFAGSLYYTYWDGVQWHTEFVDGNSGATTGANVGLYARLRLDNFGRPHIAYFDAVNGDLKYAIRNVTGGWQVFVVDSGGPANDIVGSYCSLVLNTSNEPRIAYFNSTAKDLKYAALTFGAWSTEVVDSAGDVGSDTSIALNPVTELPEIAYRDSFNKSLKFASFDGNMWDRLTVDAGSDTGYTPTMVIDAGGNAHIAYQMFNGTTSALIYAMQSGQVFYTKTVVAGTGPDTGFVPSLALDNGGHPHVAFNDAKTHSLVFAVYNGIEWLTDVLDTSAVGSYVSLDLYQNVPGIAYWSFTGLRYIEAKSASITGGDELPDDANVDATDNSGGGGCFIATAAFGTIAASSVTNLCSVRDGCIAASDCGNALVKLYYQASPEVAAGMTGSVKAVFRSLIFELGR